MADLNIFDTIDRLRREERPFCVATVIRTADVTSAKAGAKAAIDSEGIVHGHLGGGCVKRAVRTAAQAALTQNAPTMIRVKPSDKVKDLQDPDGFQAFKSGCPSGGTVEILIEPYQPAPRLAIFGDGPIAQALFAHAALADFRVEKGEDGLRDFSPRDFVVVASQGQNDTDALQAALESDAARVSMVASRRKAEVLSERLLKKGLDPACVTRLKSPAGLDIQAVDPHEIAISILAEIVKWRNRDAQSDKRGQNEKLA